ncbi:MAG: rod shape-determining protein MreC [Candidatus Omnitrophica bacterium]|nr:rod shape-determining protein MreC [Candidatus Omnitrophota bacterium]
MSWRLDKIKKNTLLKFTSIIFLLLVLASLVSVLRNPALNILRYPLGVLSLIRQELLGIIFYHRNMVENTKLSQEIDLLNQKLNHLNEIYLENKRLNMLLSLKQNISYKVTAARVIGRSPDNWSSVILIDKGIHQGIKVGYPVVSYLGLVGRITEVTNFISKVVLINDPHLGVSAIVQRSRQEGLVSGTLGGSLIMRYLPKGADIKISDVIVTSGLSEFYPKGLLIGTVVEIGEEFSGLSKYAVIKPAVDLNKLEEVLVIIP